MYQKLYHGAAYYPELWDKETIEQDIAWMKETGINVVRMGEFAWTTMEPDEGKIDLDFFAWIIDHLYENGIETILCTPTPTPPIWLTHNHPERMLVDVEGRIMSHGHRQHICTNNAYFRSRSDIITEAMAKRFAGHPSVIAWQLDNEFKCGVAECYCDTCKGLWHEWLEEKYGTVDALNDAWGTEIWSEKYQRFDQVVQPKKTVFIHNSSLATMYQLFSYEKIAEFARTQEDIIRKYSKAPITHNSHTDFSVDNWLLFRDLDFTSFDDYPDCDHYQKMLYNYDFFRNVKQDGRFWVMETSTSHNGCLVDHAKTHRRGYLVAEAVCAYAAGAMGFNYWLWRQQKSGCEQPHGSVLHSWGKPTIGYEDVLKVEEARQQLEQVLLSTTVKQADVAITYSATARAFFRTEPYEPDMNYLQEIIHIHEIVTREGLSRDVVSAEGKLDGYKVVLTPFLPYVEDSLIQNALRVVEDGGVWIVGPMTGLRTGQHTVPTDRALGNLEKALGIDIKFVYPVTGTGATMRYKDNQAELKYFASVPEKQDDAKVLAKISSGVTPDQPIIMEIKRGKGSIVFLGAMPDGTKGDHILGELISRCANKAGSFNRYGCGLGTVAYERTDGENDFVLFINMDGNGGPVALTTDHRDIFSGETVHNTVFVEPYGYRVFQKIKK